MQHAAKDDVITSLSSRQRLADISHHFLSGKGEQPAPWQKTRLIPLLLISRKDDFVAYLIKGALQRDDQHCTVLNIENQSSLGSLSASIKNESQTTPDICLLPLTSPASILAIPHNKLLMAVPASLPGMRLAYHRLAQLAEQKSHLTVNIIMLDARSEKHGARYFSFLCNSAQSLLSLDIKSLGALYRQHADANNSHSNDDANAIVKNLLINDSKNASPAARPGVKNESPQIAITRIAP